MSPRMTVDSGKFGSKLQHLSHKYRLEKERREQQESLGFSTLRSRRMTLEAVSKTNRGSTLGKDSLRNWNDNSIQEDVRLDGK